jgi:membrane protease subunit (stomatin/prohibitin family)
MGLFDFIGKQFIDVIEWTESESGILSFRFPMADREIQNGAHLTVRESQFAVFVNEGVVADVFGPGRYRLTTQTLPVLTQLKHWETGFQSPFKSDVYFFSSREQMDNKWGTPNPLTVVDPKLGPIRIRAFGTYSYKIEDPKIFHSKVSGTQEVYMASALDGQLRSGAITQMGAFLAGAQKSFLEMAANQVSFSEAIKSALTPFFKNYGLMLESFFVQSLSLPEELQTVLDKSTAMNLLGDLKRYAQFQSAEAITLAAKNESGMAALGAQMGAGVMVGQMFQNSMGANMNAHVSGQEGENPLKTIESLHELVKKGILSEQEFQEKKKELLKKV